jgi:hypothetical protein
MPETSLRPRRNQRVTQGTKIAIAEHMELFFSEVATVRLPIQGTTYLRRCFAQQYLFQPSPFTQQYLV